VRVHELAKELGVPSKEILAALEEMGLGGRTASSAVPDEAVPRLRASGGKVVPGAKPKTATVEPLPERRPEPKAEPAAVASPNGAGDGRPADGVQVAEPEPQPLAEVVSALPAIKITRGASPQDIAEKTGRTAAEVVKTLFSMGEMVSATHSLPDDTIEKLAGQLGFEAQIVGPDEGEDL
jgi:hypothetical protein